ncbi:aspartate--tRNA ligase [Burkholderia oklahomensis]|nr:aspartate--tRNA ligase [Burkholderia oklahomensis]AOI38997.1 aspartate--tRNA(Asp/Asn) ligase [Burkholderia oklahomensis EO147]KUY52135.1 aspartate--tRNA(Asp/Asn) ligase [Burkholderia oklahomensis EO147]QPS40656.1 aspartate--tRNA ligase [Burkholderia oklahomensis]
MNDYRTIDVKRPSTRYRTDTCGQLRSDDIGRATRLAGWVHRIRDHGNVIFLDLRDHYGITQAVISSESQAFPVAQHIRPESVINLFGTVRPRPSGTFNADLATGDIEVLVERIDVLSNCVELPLPIFGEPDFPEEIRLTYRFLELRRQTLHRNIMLRSAIVAELRQAMWEAGFTEFQTPILTASSPEGARDFLVPSRTHPGKFYALPQAPQQFKQLAMISGFDRYFQIAPCFRDEDARADRSPGEFYQLDIEMSFVDQEDVFSTIEPIIRGIFQKFGNGFSVTEKFPRIPYGEAIRRYGSDKPDLRNPLSLRNVTETFRGSSFRLFADMLRQNAMTEVWAIRAPGGGTRAFCEQVNQWAREQGKPGVAYVIDGPSGFSGPIAKALSNDTISSIASELESVTGDSLFFIAGVPRDFYKFAGELRQHLATKLDLIAKQRFEFCWITDFPMYEWAEKEQRIDFCHNPFSLPQGGFEALEAAVTVEQQLALKAYQYDIVCNGIELSSGAIRNHVPEIMYKAFEIAGYRPADLEDKFGGMLRALQFGAPPHGGIAPGIDRIVMLLAGASNLRDVVMFPMNQQGEDLMMGAPSTVAARQLTDLHIQIVPPSPVGRD